MADLQVELEIDTKKASSKAKKDLKKTGEDAGESFAEKFSESVEKGVERTTRIVSGTLKFVAARAASLSVSAFLSAKQEQVVQNLETSLRRIGEFTPQASQSIQDFASDLQSLSTVGDEVILQQIAIAQSFGATASQSQRLVAAALDVSSAQGKSLSETTRQLSKTLGGYAGELGETLPIIKEFTQEQLRAGVQIDVIAKKFEGFAADSVKTFGGAVKQTTNLLGDLLEADGEFITQSPEVTAAVLATGQSFKVLTEVIRNANIGAREFLGKFILGSLSVLRELQVGISDFVKRFFNRVDSIASGFNSLLNSIKKTGSNLLNALTAPFRKWATSAKGFIGSVITFIESLPFGKILADKIRGGIDIAGGAFDGLKEKANGVFGALSGGAKTAVDNIVGVENVEKITSFVSAAGEQFRGLATSLFVDGENGQQSIFGKVLEPFSEENINKIIENIKKLSSGVTEQTKDLSGKVKIAAADINQALEASLEKGAVSSFAAFGKAIASGGGFLDSFVALALNTLGDLAISIGTTVIKAAIAIDAFKKSIAGSPLVAIAAGGALVAFGAAIKAFSSSFGGGGSGSSTVGGGVATTPDRSDQTFSRFEREEREEAQTRVSVTIQGDVFDQESTGLRLAEILENASLNNNVRVVGGLA